MAPARGGVRCVSANPFLLSPCCTKRLKHGPWKPLIEELNEERDGFVLRWFPDSLPEHRVDLSSVQRMRDHEGDAVAVSWTDRGHGSAPCGDMRIHSTPKQLVHGGRISHFLIILMQIDDRVCKDFELEGLGVVIGELFPNGWYALLPPDCLPANMFHIASHGFQPSTEVFKLLLAGASFEGGVVTQECWAVVLVLIHAIDLSLVLHILDRSVCRIWGRSIMWHRPGNPAVRDIRLL